MPTCPKCRTDARACFEIRPGEGLSNLTAIRNIGLHVERDFKNQKQINRLTDHTNPGNRPELESLESKLKKETAAFETAKEQSEFPNLFCLTCGEMCYPRDLEVIRPQFETLNMR